MVTRNIAFYTLIIVLLNTMRRAYYLLGVNTFISLAEVVLTGHYHMDTSST